MQTTMRLTTGQIAEQLGGQLEGDGSLVIHYLTSVDGAEDGALAFVHNPRFVAKLYQSNATAVLVAPDFVPEQAVKPVLIRVPDPYKSFIGLLIEHYSNGQQPVGVHPKALVHETATLGQGVYIAAGAQVAAGAVLGDQVQVHEGAFVGPNAKIGPGTILYPGASVLRTCEVGARCRIHSGAVIGSDGFGFIELKGQLAKVPQIGNVVIGDDVEIGANSTIDRATIGSTLIGDGTKVDNLVHIAHNVEIGRYCILAGQVGIAGSVKMGDGVILGGQVGITGHVELANGVQISAKSGLSKTVSTPGAKLRGYPARELHRQLKLEALIGKLPELMETLNQLRQKVQLLEASLPNTETSTDKDA